MATAIRFDRSVSSLPPGTFQARPDNLSTMLFIAALFHSVLVLGVSFTAGSFDESASEGTAVDVVLLAREYEDRADNEDASYIAQQNLAGSGNTTDNDELRVAYGRNTNPFKPGPEQDGVEQSTDTANYASGAEQILYARSRDSAATSKQEDESTPSEAPERTGMPGTANTIEILATPDMETVLQGAKPRELIVSANTRESRIAWQLSL